MNQEVLARHFGKMGARVVTGPQDHMYRFNVLKDNRGEYFELLAASEVELEVLDLRPETRHLLLMARHEVGWKDKFLCGHDERTWFVAAVPADRGVSNVPTALEALKPELVRLRQNRLKLSNKERTLRRNAAFVRQGEWFFVPVPEFKQENAFILRNELLRRDWSSNPHVCEMAVRLDGEPVYINPHDGKVFTVRDYEAYIRRKPVAKKWRWSTAFQNPELYVMGRIRHPDHKTLFLPFWHRVEISREHLAPGAMGVAFLD